MQQSSSHASAFAILAAIATGGLLTLMTFLNGKVAAGGTPLLSSWAAHGVGSVAALVLFMIVGRKSAKSSSKAPLWSYFAGLAGAAIVILTSTTVNTALALSGTVALGLAGQMVFGLSADVWGFFGLPKRRPTIRELVSFTLICVGSLIILFYGKG